MHFRHTPSLKRSQQVAHHTHLKSSNVIGTDLALPTLDPRVLFDTPPEIGCRIALRNTASVAQSTSVEVRFAAEPDRT